MLEGNGRMHACASVYSLEGKKALVTLRSSGLVEKHGNWWNPFYFRYILDILDIFRYLDILDILYINIYIFRYFRYILDIFLEHFRVHRKTQRKVRGFPLSCPHTCNTPTRRMVNSLSHLPHAVLSLKSYEVWGYHFLSCMTKWRIISLRAWTGAHIYMWSLKILFDDDEPFVI